MSERPLVARAKGRGRVPRLMIKRTPAFEEALARALAGLVAAGETAHLNAQHEPIIAAVIVAGLDALADRAERRAARAETGVPLVAARAPRGRIHSRLLPVARTPAFEEALARALSGLAAAGETTHIDTQGEPVLAAVIVGALEALADVAEKRATRSARRV
jgi:hypothetical protein